MKRQQNFMLASPSNFDDIYWHCPHKIIMFSNICIPHFSFHIRKRLFRHAWLMTAMLVHCMLQWRSSRVKTGMWYTILIREKSRIWAHLEQLSTSLFCANSDFLVVQKILNKMYISGFVNTICGTKMCEMTKNKRNIIYHIIESPETVRWRAQLALLDGDNWSRQFTIIIGNMSHQYKWIPTAASRGPIRNGKSGGLAW